MHEMQEYINEYRSLLVLEASLEGVSRAVSLIQRLLAVSFRLENRRFRFSLINPGYETDESRRIEIIRESIYPEFCEAALRIRRKEHTERQQQNVLNSSFAVGILPQIARHLPAGRSEFVYSLYLDTCIVLIHHAYFALLSDLYGRSWDNERNSLLKAFFIFSQNDDLYEADKNLILGLYYEALSDFQRAKENYDNALVNTRPDAHEFMTVLQTYWTFCIEHNDVDNAYQILKESRARVPYESKPEIEELISLTSEF